MKFKQNSFIHEWPTDRSLETIIPIRMESARKSCCIFETVVFSKLWYKYIFEINITYKIKMNPKTSQVTA